MATKTSGGDGMDYRITIIAFNFDITANWATGDLAFPVTDQASFEVFLASRNYNYTNNLTNIVISNFSIVGNRITCNLSADGTILDISNMQVTDITSIGNLGQLQYLYLNNNQIITFDPTIALPSSLQVLYLGQNQIITFDPTIALPSSLQVLYLYNNQIITFDPTIALPISLQYLHLNNNQIITFDPTIALPISLQSLHLYNNQMTIAGYTASETWANTQPIFTSLCNVTFNSNIDNVSGTNLESILISKNCNVIT